MAIIPSLNERCRRKVCERKAVNNRVYHVTYQELGELTFIGKIAERCKGSIGVLDRI